MEQLTAGELAKRVGITSRTVRYYDNKGLLKPNDRSSTGYRLYDQKCVVRLQQIIVLKFLGFSLDEIALHLEANEKCSFAEILDNQLFSLRRRQEQLNMAIDTLEELNPCVPEAHADQLIEIMQRLNMVIRNN